MIYLASPYSHDDPDIREERFEAVCGVAAELMAEHIVVFSPIAHTHPIAEHGNLDGMDADFWLKFDKEFILRSEVVWVLMLDGWRESYGVNWETEFAKEHDIPVGYIDPETLELTHEPVDILCEGDTDV